MVLLHFVNKALTLCGLLWGMYQSFKVLKLRGHHSKFDFDDDDGGDAATEEDRAGLAECRRMGTDMLMYWVVLSLIALYDQYLELFVFWLPFYDEAKCVFLFCLLVPQLRLPRYIYEVLLMPIVASRVLPAVNRLTPVAMTRLSALGRGLQESVLHLTARGVPDSELKAWEGALRKQLAATRAERTRRLTGSAGGSDGGPAALGAAMAGR
mmetsp:Transcript_113565/g.315957  ORF Transcript_113565/g.315957 Transcript_113565/m.315957 type:complete len:210 (+) Transcript_113565:232-861(+)